MLDIAIYRQNESLAKKEMDKWQIRSRHNLDPFEKVGFPVRVENNQQLMHKQIRIMRLRENTSKMLKNLFKKLKI